MPRNLVICCDGTNNQFGSNNTNVVRLVQAIRRDPAIQRVYYDPGVGTFPEPGWVTRAGKFISDLGGLAFGAGLSWKVQEAYSYLMDFWEPGDQVFLFGFSRGSYCVRVLAGLLHELGLMAHGSSNMLPYAMRLYATARYDRKFSIKRDDSDYWKLRDDFRRTFARPLRPGDEDRRFPIHFAALWDTVSSVGWVWDPTKFPFTTHNPSISTVRHAVSIDERRWFFRQNLMEATGDQDLIQAWFPGCHCDVGGGYPLADGSLWQSAFDWILAEASTAGLQLDESRLSTIQGPAGEAAKPWMEPKHESLKGAWWIAEFFPKLCPWPGHRWPIPRLGLGRHRIIAPGQLLHRTSLLRIRDDSRYDPPNLSSGFRQKVRDLTEVPDYLGYDP
jgi:uncharacterized protein (DUF2235 family)